MVSCFRLLGLEARANPSNNRSEPSMVQEKFKKAIK
jgi:hypothetical protein